MKKLLTILTLIICIYANTQNKIEIVTTSISSDKVNDIDKQLVEVQTQFRKDIDVAIRDLQVQLRALKKEVADLKQGIDLNELIEVLQVKPFSDENDLPKDLAPDEIGVAFVKKPNEATQLYISINNQWTILRL